MLSENNKIGLILLTAVLFSVYCFVFGQSGILERLRFQDERAVLVDEIARLQEENTRLLNLRAEYVSGKRAYAECENAGFVSPGNRILFFKKTDGEKTVSVKKQDAAEQVPIEYLRIAWVSFSALAILLYYIIMLRRRRPAAEARYPEDSL